MSAVHIICTILDNIERIHNREGIKTFFPFLRDCQKATFTVPQASEDEGQVMCADGCGACRLYGLLPGGSGHIQDLRPA